MSFFALRDDIEPLMSRARLNILVLLSTLAEADFTCIREIIGLADGQLSQQLTKLSDFGLIEVNRSIVGKKSRTVVQITPAGSVALARWMEDTRKLVEQVPSMPVSKIPEQKRK